MAIDTVTLPDSRARLPQDFRMESADENRAWVDYLLALGLGDTWDGEWRSFDDFAFRLDPARPRGIDLAWYLSQDEATDSCQTLGMWLSFDDYSFDELAAVLDNPRWDIAAVPAMPAYLRQQARREAVERALCQEPRYVAMRLLRRHGLDRGRCDVTTLSRDEASLWTARHGMWFRSPATRLSAFRDGTIEPHGPVYATVVRLAWPERVDGFVRSVTGPAGYGPYGTWDWYVPAFRSEVAALEWAELVAADSDSVNWALCDGRAGWPLSVTFQVVECMPELAPSDPYESTISDAADFARFSGEVVREFDLGYDRFRDLQRQEDAPSQPER